MFRYVIDEADRKVRGARSPEDVVRRRESLTTGQHEIVAKGATTLLEFHAMVLLLHRES